MPLTWETNFKMPNNWSVNITVSKSVIHAWAEAANFGIKKDIRSGKRKPPLWVRKVNIQNIPWIMRNYQNFIKQLKGYLFETFYFCMIIFLNLFFVRKNLSEHGNLLMAVKLKINSSRNWNWSKSIIVFSPCLKV